MHGVFNFPFLNDEKLKIIATEFEERKNSLNKENLFLYKDKKCNYFLS